MLRLPLLIPALGWVTGLAAARTDWVSWPILAWLAGITVLFLFVSKTRKAAAVFLAGIVWGAINLVWDARSVTFDKGWLEGVQPVTASVVKTQHTQTYTRLTLRWIHRFEHKDRDSALRGQAWLYAYQYAANKIRPGDRIRVQARWHAPRNHNNPGGFDFEAYCFDRHIALIGSARGPVIILASDRSWLEVVRQHIRNALKTLPDASRGILEALLLADRSHIPIRITDAFAATGTMHLLAISGLHIGMAAAIGFALCWWLLTRREAWIIRFPVRGVALISGMFVAVAYASLAGWPLPAQRAAMMLAAGVLAWWSKAHVAPLNTLLAALILILLLDAQAVGSISLWLSFTATAAILFWAGRRESHADHFHIGSAFIAMLWVTLIASLATLPLIADTFGRLPIYSLPANVVMVPLYSLFILPLALAGTVFVCLGMSGTATGLFSVAAYGIDAGNHLLTWMLQWPDSHLWIPVVPWWLTGFYVTGAVLTTVLLWKGKRRIAWLSMVSVVLFYVMLAVQEHPPDHTELIAWDVGQGAAASLVMPDGRVMVVDAPGRRGSRFNGGTTVAAGLRAEGITHIDALVITHAQSDHMGGMMRLMDQVNDVKELWLADVPGIRHHPYIQRLIQHVQAQGGRVRWLKLGENIKLGGIKGQVLWPPAGYAPTNPNNASLVFSLQLENGARILFPGDIEAKAESGMMAHAMTAFDIMLMPHHGSATSSTPEFVRVAMPKVVIAQTGYANRYGFPKAQVVRRYEHAGAQILNTAQGAVMVVPDDKDETHAVYAAPVRSGKRYRALRLWNRYAAHIKP